MQLPPISVLASWPVANFVNPTDTRGPAMLILTVIFMPISMLVVALRIYTRVRISRSFGADDVCIVLAAIFTAICGILVLIAVQRLGWKRHTWDVPPADLVTGLKYAMVLEISFAGGCTFTKLSLLLFLRRLMSPWRGMFRILTWTLIAISATEWAIFSIVVLNTCRPISAYWVFSFAPQQCINEPAHLLAGGIINTVTDFCVVILPLPMVLKLHLPRRQQIILIALFGAGFVAVFAGAVRIYYTYQLNNAYDKTWVTYPLWIAATVELYLGIIAASIPATKKLVSRYLPKILYSTMAESQDPVLKSESLPDRTATRFSGCDVEKSAEEKRDSLQPVISTFSTWRQVKRNIPNPPSQWKSAHPPAELFMDKQLPLPPPSSAHRSPSSLSTISQSPPSSSSTSPPPEQPLTMPPKIKLPKDAKSFASSRSSISSFNVTSPTDLAASWETHGPLNPLVRQARSEGDEEEQVDTWNNPAGELQQRFESWRNGLRRIASG